MATANTYEGWDNDGGGIEIPSSRYPVVSQQNQETLGKHVVSEHDKYREQALILEKIASDLGATARRSYLCHEESFSD